MDMPTLTNAICLALTVCSVLIVAYDHKKWTQSNYRYGLMYFAWVPLLAINCMAVFALGGGRILTGVWLVGFAAIIMAGGFAYRALRTNTQAQATPAPRARLHHSLNVPRRLKT